MTNKYPHTDFFMKNRVIEVKKYPDRAEWVIKLIKWMCETILWHTNIEKDRIAVKKMRDLYLGLIEQIILDNK